MRWLSGRRRQEASGLDDAWAAVLDLINAAIKFGEHEEPGGRAVGWWPGPGTDSDQDAEGRASRLYHIVYDPLGQADIDSVTRGWLPQGLPRDLHDFLLRCSNGLTFASGDLVLLGKKRRLALDPSTGFSGVESDGRKKVHFANWGSHYVWIDVHDGTIGAGSTGSRYLRTWQSFPSFLMEACSEHATSFDAEGRRTGFAHLPSLPAAPTDFNFLPPALQVAAKNVETTLAQSPRTVRTSAGTFDLIRPEELLKNQIGYGIDAQGHQLAQPKKGAWPASWLVIGHEVDLGDPLIADLSSDELRVITAAHGAGRWDATQVASSLSELLSGGEPGRA